MVKEINTAEYESIINSDTSKVVIMDFHASWCNPCKMLAPVLEELASKNKNVKVYKVDVDDNSKLADDLNIHSVPTLLFYKNGEIVKQVMGFQPLASIERIIKTI